MWISKRKWRALEKRVTALEEQLQSQPEKIAETIRDQMQKQLTKPYFPRYQEYGN